MREAYQAIVHAAWHTTARCSDTSRTSGPGRMPWTPSLCLREPPDGIEGEEQRDDPASLGKQQDARFQ
jgi:hypothetical protein